MPTPEIQHRRVPSRRSTAKRHRRTLAAVAVASAAVCGVLLAPSAGAADRVVADDAMQRTTTSGLGSAAVGGAYTLDSAKDFAVGGGIATITLPAGSARTATLATTKIRDVRHSAAFAFPALPTTGNGYSAATVLRRTSAGDAYIARMRLAPGGQAYLGLARRAANGTTTELVAEQAVCRLVPGQWFTVDATATGTDPVTLRARAWVRGATAPGWQLSASDSSAARLTGAGAVGVFTYGSGSSPASKVHLDDVRATEVPTTTVTPPPVTPPPVTPPPVTPPPVTPPPVTPPPAVAPAPARAADSAGTTVGSTRYPVPAQAVVVSPTGSDSAAGTAAAPFRTVTKAVAAAPAGATVVLRAGSYHESVVLPRGKKLVVQSWPGEEVWFEGSSVVTGWEAGSRGWVKQGWTTEFDASPTYTWGATEAGAASGWRFVNPNHPMAAHPDQVWVDGVAQRQVGSLAEVVAGSFFHDRAADRLHLGTDPRGRTVRVSDLQQSINVRSAGSVLRGFGVRRYAPSVPHMGGLTAEQPGVVLEELAVLDSATTGVAIAATDVTVRHVTIARSGMLGMTATYADRLVVDGLRSEGNNVERFNTSPVSGGFKTARSRDVLVRDSVLQGNHGPGFWADESVHDVKVVGNDLRDNAGHGASLELSAKAVFADNVVTGNSRDGVKINNTSDVQVWNNTFAGNGRHINLVQDSRRASDRSTPGHDPRQAFPDPTMTWLLGPAAVSNNVLANPRAGTNCLLCVEDYSHERSAAQIGVRAESNVYNRATASAPSWVVVWSRGVGDPQVFTDLAAFSRSAGQEARGTLVTGAPVVDGRGRPTAAMPADGTAQPLPAAIAALTGEASGARHLGAWTS
ncbi:right-handed parallel beta-helix repeat-containing protein [uncultured Pseudokineococcus sp.]|uniref:right-handed parallel beta-helix repeat-containing protein n=1 Tax=uncultured Pseudokineococcus sp. TaxID=1642928 RepID=UPI00260E12BE|nr:right-handed parallel beta-helix repeat-containing protein [uncultured Pseudokineococcus sp.]